MFLFSPKLSPLETSFFRASVRISFPCDNFSFHSPIHSKFHIWLYLQQIQVKFVNGSGPKIISLETSFFRASVPDFVSVR